ncbi:MAG: hypothetical protein FJW37_04015, partial [Acidobacteria bacterium]|nr:hypothetical protein [Acidobacteriota bacterium]
MALSSAAEKLESFRETQQMLDQPENLRTAFEQDGYLFLPGAPIEAIDDHPLYGLGTYQALAESRLMLD